MVQSVAPGFRAPPNLGGAIKLGVASAIANAHSYLQIDAEAFTVAVGLWPVGVCGVGTKSYPGRAGPLGRFS